MPTGPDCESRETGTHTRITGPLRSWEGLNRDLGLREGEIPLLDGELEVLCNENSFEAVELRQLLHVRVHATRGQFIAPYGSRRERKRRYYEFQRARKA